MRSPYGRNGIVALLAQVFANRGHITVIQSCRGTYGSGGVFNPFFQEAADGIDPVGGSKSSRGFPPASACTAAATWADAAADDGMAMVSVDMTLHCESPIPAR